MAVAGFYIPPWAALLLLLSSLPNFAHAATIPPVTNNTLEPTDSPAIEPNTQSWVGSEFPNPQTEYLRCGQRSPSFICDPAKLLDDDSTRKLENLLENVRMTRPCVCGCEAGGAYHDTYIKIAVGVVPDITGFYDTYQDRKNAVSAFAALLRDYVWDFDNGCGDDAVIVFSVKERMLWTRLGDATYDEGLTGNCVQDIWDENSKYFTDGSYGTGLISMVTSYKDALLGYRYCSSSGNDEGEPAIPIWAIILIIVASVGGLGLCILFCCCCGCCKGGGGSYSSSHHHSSGWFGGDSGGGGGWGGGGGGGDGGGGGF